MTEEVRVEGLREILAALRELPKAVQKRAVNTALAAAARIIVKDAKALAPVLQQPDQRRMAGAIKKAIRAKVKRGAEVPTLQVGVATGKGKGKANAFYWRFLEFGTSKQPAQPFLRPAFEAKKHEAVDAFKERLDARIQIEAEKLGRR